MSELAIIGGTGFFLESSGYVVGCRSTPYGETSEALNQLPLGDREVVFLARHGIPHSIPPHLVNYRANIWALKEAGVKRIVAINAVGGIPADWLPGSLIIPNQLIDYTYGREHTYSDGNGSELLHVDFTEPYDQALRTALLAAAKAAGVSVVDGAVYGATQGPRLESAAEVDRLERDGCDLIGMTGMPEAALARELGLAYASLCIVVNPAAGRSDQPITLEDIHKVLEQGVEEAKKLLGLLP
jgi:5'-methylthioinosine phosphorylase